MYNILTDNYLNKNDKVIEVKEINPITNIISTFIKCLLIGSSGVGKSSILERYVSNNFHQHFITTIGVDYKYKDILFDNYKIKLQLWDTASQERFRCITSNYYRNSHIIIVCFDITDSYSFKEIDYWINDAKRFISDGTTIALCGTKLDLNLKRVIFYEEAKVFAEYNGMKYFEISSKTGEGINVMFENLLKLKISEPEFIKLQIQSNIIEEKYEVLSLNNNNNSSYYDYEITCCQ